MAATVTGVSAKIGAKPSQPEDWPPPARCTARHHVFPYARLRDLWNALVHSASSTQLPEAYMALRRFILLGGRQIRNVDELVVRIRRQNITVPEFETLSRQLMWHRWNIVEGYLPNRQAEGSPCRDHRIDNPGNYELDKFNYGITRSEFHRMIRIRDFFEEQIAIALPIDAALHPELLRRLADMFERYRPHLIEEDIVPFRPGMWENVGPHQFEKRRRGEQFIPG